MQTAITNTIEGDNISFMLKDGSLPDEEFYQLHKGTSSIRFSRILEKIDYCKRRLMTTEELEDSLESLRFSSEGISLAWINPEDFSGLVPSPCTDKTVHIGPFRDSPWVVPVFFFREDVLRMLSKIHPHRSQTEIFCKMTVQSVNKSNKLSLAKVGIR